MILILTECGGAPFGPRADHTVYINSDHIQTWTSAASPLGATCITLLGRDAVGDIFVRESPHEVWELMFEVSRAALEHQVDAVYENARADVLPGLAPRELTRGFSDRGEYDD